VEDWALEPLNPNRLKFLAHVARTSGAQALQRAPAERRYPLLIAFLSQALADVTDEVIEMFDRCLADAYARAGQDLEDFRKAMAHAMNEKVYLFAHNALWADLGNVSLPARARSLGGRGVSTAFDHFPLVINHPILGVPDPPDRHLCSAVRTPERITSRALLIPLAVGQPGNDLDGPFAHALHLG